MYAEPSGGSGSSKPPAGLEATNGGASARGAGARNSAGAETGPAFDSLGDTRRGAGSHLAFGGGPHFCLGTWVARVSIADVALPTLFRRLPDLALADPERVRMAGWVFRGPLSLDTTWST